MKPYIILFLSLIIVSPSTAQVVEEFQRFAAPNATQAVAVDSLYIYSISNSRIVKRKKKDGQIVSSWEGPLKHLNSGIILHDKLYCANTNFPESPMASSIEIFDPETLTHIDSHSFGIYAGSCTWIDWYKGHWYVMFVHYDEKGKERDLDASYSTLVEFDTSWRRTAGWIVPKKLVDHLRPMSISGGTFDNNGQIYVSPHHFNELYVLKFPKMGYELEWIYTLEVPFEGQGISWDPFRPNIIYGIHRKQREIIGVKLLGKD